MTGRPALLPDMRMPQSIRLAACMAALTCLPALAHDSWLAAGSRTVQAGALLALDMTSAEHFPKPGTGIAPERIESAACLQAGQRFALQPGDRTGAVLQLSARPPAAGGVLCWVQLKPRALDLAPGKVQEYLDEIDAPAAVRAAWTSGPRRWHETYTKHAKVIVPAPGRPATQPQAPVGLALEFVPLSDWSTGQPGERLALQVLRGGQPLAGLSVALTGEQGPPAVRQRSDANGRVSFSRPAPGRWMLSATDLRPVGTDGSWDSHFSTLVFELLVPSP